MTTMNDTTTGAQASQDYDICSDLMIKIIMGSELTSEDTVHLIQILFFVMLSEKIMGCCTFQAIMLTAYAKTEAYLDIMEREAKEVIKEQEAKNAAE